MLFVKRLPQNFKETLLFIAVISILSVNLIAPLITGFEIGFSWQMWQATLRVIPFIWVAVVVLVVLTQKPAEYLASHLMAKTDSFQAQMLITALCNVFLMSIFLTVIGTWIGSGQISMAPITHFGAKWPRNFALAFIVEAFIAQPIARSVMQLIHH